jgi:pimeloyl-ACP methyl ester carboxylesterase
MIAWIVGIVVALVGLIVTGLVLYTVSTAGQVENRLPPRGRFIDVDGARIHYLDEGTGPTLLLVHGLAGQMLNFTHSLLGKLTPHFRVIVIDRPGSGYSTRPKGASATISGQARTISRFCQELKLGRPVIVGHSLGGAIALALALNHPEQVAGLALLAPVTHRPDRVPPPFDRMAIASPVLRRLIAWTLATPLSIAKPRAGAGEAVWPAAGPARFCCRGRRTIELATLQPHRRVSRSDGNVRRARRDAIAI